VPRSLLFALSPDRPSFLRITNPPPAVDIRPDLRSKQICGCNTPRFRARSATPCRRIRRINCRHRLAIAYSAALAACAFFVLTPRHHLSHPKDKETTRHYIQHASPASPNDRNSVRRNIPLSPPQTPGHIYGVTSKFTSTRLSLGVNNNPSHLGHLPASIIQDDGNQIPDSPALQPETIIPPDVIRQHADLITIVCIQ